MSAQNYEIYVDWSKAITPNQQKVDPPVNLGDDPRQYGACSGVEPDLFFPERGESLEPAVKVCASCIVKTECLEYAIVNRERSGVWGGESERSRRRIIKARKVAKLSIAQGDN